MIQLTRLNSEVFALNTDLIERVEATPDTVLTLIDGTKYVVAEPLDAVIARIIDFRARVVATAGDTTPAPPLHLVAADAVTTDDSGANTDAGQAPDRKEDR